MQIAAMILGVLGGLSGLIIGWIFYAAKSFFNAGGLLHIIIPMIGLVGGSLSMASPMLAAAMMSTSALFIILTFGFNPLGAIPALLLAIAAVNAVISTQDGAAKFAASSGPQTGLQDLEQNLRRLYRRFADRAARGLNGIGRPNLETATAFRSERGFGGDGHAASFSLVPARGGSSIPLPHRKLANGGIVIGRADNNAVVIKDNSISRSHARIWIDGQSRLMIEDLGSTNGTWCNDQKIGRATLQPRATVRMGDVTFALAHRG